MNEIFIELTHIGNGIWLNRDHKISVTDLEDTLVIVWKTLIVMVEEDARKDGVWYFKDDRDNRFFIQFEPNAGMGIIERPKKEGS